MIHARRSWSVAAAAAVVLCAGPALAQVELTAPSEPTGSALNEAAPAPSVAPAEAPPVVPAGPPLEVVRRYRAGRIVAGTGTAISLIGSGLTLGSLLAKIVIDTEVERRPIAQGLAYAGAGANALGVILSATGLGLQHSALAQVGADPGRGLYATGTVFGVIGLVAMGGSYFFGDTYYVYGHPGEEHQREALVFGTTIASAVLLSVSSILYFSDSRRLGRAYKRLTTF